MISLYPNQQPIYDETQNAFDFYEEVLVQAPTGFGKTVLIGNMALGAVRNDHQSIIQAHRIELLDQISDTLTRCGVPHGWIHGDRYYDPSLPVHLTTPFSLMARADKVKKPSFVFEDECHHSPSKTYGKIREWIGKETLVAGFTATPQRLDGKPLSDRFQYMVRGPKISDLIKDGTLVPARVYAPPISFDVSELKKGANDWTQKSGEKVLNNKKVIGDLIDHYVRLAYGTSAVVFANSVGHAIEIAAEFNARGITAAAIYCDMPPDERARIIRSYRLGEILVLTNYELVSEGFDLPKIQTCIMERFTESLALFLQMVGRAIRSDRDNGKTHAIVLDHVGNCFRHGMPDQDRHWSLQHGHASTEADISAHKQCPECFVFLKKATRVCYCGYDFSKGKGKARVFSTDKSGRLELVKDSVATEISTFAAFKRDQMKIKDKSDFTEFLAVAKKHGYSTAWARIRFDKMKEARGRYVKKDA